MAIVGAMYGAGSSKVPGVEICPAKGTLMFLEYSVNVLCVFALVRPPNPVTSCYTAMFELNPSTDKSVFRMSLLERQ